VHEVERSKHKAAPPIILILNPAQMVDLYKKITPIKLSEKDELVIERPLDHVVKVFLK